MDLVDGFLQRISDCNVGLEELPTLMPFLIEGKEVGKMKPGFVDHLRRFPDTFVVDGLGPSGRVSLAPQLDSCDKRSAKVAEVLSALRAEGHISGWRDELYPVVPSFQHPPLLLVERAAATHLGIKAYGIHVNGFVRQAGGGLALWVARRSLTKPNWPGKLDHIVAGGQPHGLSCRENVEKECGEEAGIPPQLAATARPVGAVSYLTISATGYKPDVLFCYDLELPPDFVPTPQDGEVSDFSLKPVDEVAELVATTTEFKTNCCLVIIDFLIRHGYLTPEQPGYLQLVAGLRSGDCS
ncbi:Nudix hydrolase 24, chloroplastic [Tetrabaena socialis]|uniref:Nudix hydrolase 24, chloroplastic n=1 Tax=Tetrabaena socialis TaxID=47790 RepID=A0A2J8A282_9CHLO|nr:Nudix hydrolase 24, chloroplastic [Tetrabaena socialis]|eukprot:PNH06646.1 Nudix hydrolase 24, chloroplastic [Tetrabaena socialis]